MYRKTVNNFTQRNSLKSSLAGERLQPTRPSLRSVTLGFPYVFSVMLFFVVYRLWTIKGTKIPVSYSVKVH